jgi:hypothetical protein
MDQLRARNLFVVEFEGGGDRLRYHDLFESAQRQAQELTLLDRVRTAVTGELNLSELFCTVVTLSPKPLATRW